MCVGEGVVGGQWMRGGDEIRVCGRLGGRLSWVGYRSVHCAKASCYVQLCQPSLGLQIIIHFLINKLFN